MTAAALLVGWFLADPPPGDAARFGPVGHLTGGRLFNRRYQDHLEWRLRYEYHTAAGPYLRAALAEARWLYDVWDCAEGAHPEWSCSAEQKREYCRRLRLLIGREAYQRAELPPCVPVWRFRELRP